GSSVSRQRMIASLMAYHEERAPTPADPALIPYGITLGVDVRFLTLWTQPAPQPAGLFTDASQRVLGDDPGVRAGLPPLPRRGRPIGAPGRAHHRRRHGVA